MDVSTVFSCKDLVVELAASLAVPLLASAADTMPLENERMAVNSSGAITLCMKNSRAAVTPAASRGGGPCVVCCVHVCSYGCRARWNADLLVSKDPNQEQGDERCRYESAKSVRLNEAPHDRGHNVFGRVSLTIVPVPGRSAADPYELPGDAG